MRVNAKLIFIGVSAALEMLLIYLGYQSGAKDLLQLIFVMPFGLYFIYGGIFDIDINLATYTVPQGERPVYRAVLFVGGVFMIGFCFYLAITGKGKIVGKYL